MKTVVIYGVNSSSNKKSFLFKEILKVSEYILFEIEDSTKISWKLINLLKSVFENQRAAAISQQFNKLIVFSIWPDE